MPHQAFVDQPKFDTYAFHKYMNRMGGAYRNQAIVLIGICLSFLKAAEQSFKQDAELSEVLQVCDETLLKAAAIPTSKHPASERDFERATWKLLRYLSRHPSNNISSKADFENATLTLLTYGSRFHSPNDVDTVNTVREYMRIAKEKDQGQRETPQRDEDLKVIEFHIMKNLSDTQPTIVRQALTNDTKRQEVLWNFLRFDEQKRLRLSQNPHFYNDLPISSNGNWREIDIRPTEENWHNNDDPKPIRVLTNSPGRVFLELGPTPAITPRAFDNVWQIDATLVFKSICGELKGESIVGAIIGDSHPRCHLEPLFPGSHPGVGGGGAARATSPCLAVQGWNIALLRELLASQDIKIRLIGCSGCTE